VVHNPITEEKNSARPVADTVENLKYLTDRALELHEPDTEEHDHLSQLALDLKFQGDTIKTPKQLEAIKDANNHAFDILMGHLHANEITGRTQAGPKPKPKQLGSGEGGPILV